MQISGEESRGSETYDHQLPETQYEENSDE